MLGKSSLIDLRTQPFKRFLYNPDPLLCVYVYVSVYVYACVCVCIQMHIHVGVREQLSVFP